MYRPSRCWNPQLGRLCGWAVRVASRRGGEASGEAVATRLRAGEHWQLGPESLGFGPAIAFGVRWRADFALARFIIRLASACSHSSHSPRLRLLRRQFGADRLLSRPCYITSTSLSERVFFFPRLASVLGERLFALSCVRREYFVFLL